ncbi:MAG: helix-turn-helix domain-containing protein [Rhodanobacter sp.]
MEYLKIAEIANIEHKSAQAIYNRIYTNKMLAEKKNGCWVVPVEELKKWSVNKYARTNILDGKRIYDNEHLSVEDAARYLNRKLSSVYYLIYRNKIKCEKKNNCWVIDRRSLDILKQIEMLKTEFNSLGIR